MASSSWLVVGLGNPGSTYARNRHNIGAMVVHELAKRAGATWKTRRLPRAETADARLGPTGFGPSPSADRLHLAIGRTFMNLSGIPVRNLLDDTKIRPDHLIVIHDELDLDLGQLRVKFGGGDNGHNGLKSIRAMVRSGDYFRVRLGISRPAPWMDVADWVLTNFDSAEQEKLKEMISLGADAVESLVQLGLDPTQSRFNS